LKSKRINHFEESNGNLFFYDEQNNFIKFNTKSKEKTVIDLKYKKISQFQVCGKFLFTTGSNVEEGDSISMINLETSEEITVCSFNSKKFFMVFPIGLSKICLVRLYYKEITILTIDWNGDVLQKQVINESSGLNSGIAAPDGKTFYLSVGQFTYQFSLQSNGMFERSETYKKVEFSSIYLNSNGKVLISNNWNSVDLICTKTKEKNSFDFEFRGIGRDSNCRFSRYDPKLFFVRNQYSISIYLIDLSLKTNNFSDYLVQVIPISSLKDEAFFDMVESTDGKYLYCAMNGRIHQYKIIKEWKPTDYDFVKNKKLTDIKFLFQ